MALLIDTLIFLVESAPKHFIRLYGEHFSSTDLLLLFPSKPIVRRTPLDRFLRVLQCLIGLVLIGVLAGLATWLVWLNPQFTFLWATLLAANIFYQYNSLR